MGDHPGDHFAMPIRELGPQPDHLLQALVLHRGGGSIGETLDGIATNRLSRYRGAGVLARFQRECRAFELLQGIFDRASAGCLIDCDCSP